MTMKKELEDQLIRAFPQLFRDVEKPPTESCMYWGCACGDGWFGLLKKLCEDIMAECDKMVGMIPEDIQFLQIKEKFGMLTVYLVGTKEMHDLAHKAADESTEVCETCGSRENVYHGWVRGWVRTVCKSCAGNELWTEIEESQKKDEPS
jgi:hypothetical protein